MLLNTWLSIYIKETQLSCSCMDLIQIGLSVAIVAYTEINERIENEQESEVEKQTTCVFHSRFGSRNRIPPVLFCVKTHFPTIYSLFVKTYEKSVHCQNLDTKIINLNLHDYKLIQKQIFSKNKRYLDSSTARMQKSSFWHCFNTCYTWTRIWQILCASPSNMLMLFVEVGDCFVQLCRS